MNERSGQTAILHSLAELRETFLAFSRMLKRQYRVEAVVSNLDVRAYRNGTCVEAFVEACVEKRSAVTWWLDIHAEGQEWLVEPSLSLFDGESRHHLVEITPSRVIDDELGSAMLNAARGLLDMPDEIWGGHELRRTPD